MCVAVSVWNNFVKRPFYERRTNGQVDDGKGASELDNDQTTSLLPALN